MRWLSRMISAIFNLPIETVVRHYNDRKFELAMAMIFFGSSIMLMFSPGSARAGGLVYLSQAFEVWTLVAIFFIVGISRIVALGLNGNWMPYGAYVRAFGAGVGAVMWLQVDASLITFGQREGVLPFSTVTYAVLAFWEAIAMYAALVGAKKDGSNRSLELGDDRGQVVATYSSRELAGLLHRAGHAGAPRDQRYPRAAQG